MQNDKHILILSSWYPTEDRPFLGNFVERNAALLARSYRITVIQTVAEHKASGIRFEHNNDNAFMEIRAYHPKGRGMLGKQKIRKRALLEAFKQIDTPQLIIGHVLLSKGWQFVEAKHYFKVPLIYVEHGSYFWKDGHYEWSWIDHFILRSVLKNADELVAVSAFLKKDMQKACRTEKIRVIGNHIDETLFTCREKKREEPVRFLHVSTLDPLTKNPKGIIDACQMLKDNGVNFRMNIISDEDYSKWIQVCKSSGLEEYVHFFGPLNWEEVPTFYHQADALVSFSDYESFSIVLAEAFSTGTPVISTPVGIADGLPESVGIRISKGNIKELCNAMESIAGGKTFDTRAICEFGAQYHSDSVLHLWNDLIQKYVP